MHLKYSNGSRQLEQRYSALHGVDANSLTLLVCAGRAAWTGHVRLATQMFRIAHRAELAVRCRTL